MGKTAYKIMYVLSLLKNSTSDFIKDISSVSYDVKKIVFLVIRQMNEV